MEMGPKVKLPDGRTIELSLSLYNSWVAEAKRHGIEDESEALELLEDRLGRLAPELLKKFPALSSTQEIEWADLDLDLDLDLELEP